MLVWITANLGTIVVLLIVAAVIALAARSIIRQKKQGKSSCGCGCASCPMSGACHREDE